MKWDFTKIITQTYEDEVLTVVQCNAGVIIDLI